MTERIEAEKAQALLASVVESSQDAIISATREGVIASWNPGSQELYGYRPEEVVGKPISILAPPEHAGQTAHFLEKIRQGERISGCETVRVCKDGRRVDVSLTISPILDAQGKITGAASIARDITARKRAEDQTRLQTAALESAANSIVITDRQGQILWVNPAFTHLTGYPASEVIGQSPRVLKSGIQDLAFYQKLWQTVLSGEVWQGEVVNRRKDGTLYTENMTITPVPDATGTVHHFIAIKQDITDRKRTEETVRASNEMVRLLLDSIPGAVYGIDTHGNCTFCNHSCLRLLGYREAADLLGKDMHALMHHTRQDGTPYPVEECHIYEAFRRGRGTHIDNETLWRRDGSSFPGEYWSRPIHRHGNVIGTVVTFINITERKEAEQQTRLQTAALESAANGIAIADRDGRLLWVNHAFTHLTGYPAGEILGQTMRFLKSGGQGKDFYDNLWQTILSGKVWKGEMVNRRKDGTLYTDDTTITPVHDGSGALTHYVAIKQDVTKRKLAEQALEERTVYLNALFEISPLGIVVLDIEGCIQMSNSAFEKLFLYSRGEIRGAKLDDFLVPEELAAEAKTLTNWCLGGASAYATSRRRRKDNSLVDVDIFGVPLLIEGEMRGFLALYQDITERKRAEADLVQYAEDLEVAKAAQEEHA